MHILLFIIYLAFISLGLPDSVLGSAWPNMHETFSVPISAAGPVSMLISGGTIVSSLFGHHVVRRLGVGKNLLFSVLMTALALLGISFSSHYLALCLFAIPLGLGAGSVDVSLNNFVALHYSATHMNWLHSCWGIGASAGPLILSFFLFRTGDWRTGYLAIALLQLALSLLLLFALPLWKRAPKSDDSTKSTSASSQSLVSRLRTPRLPLALLAVFSYCALEACVGLWSSTFITLVRGLPADEATGWVALYYLGITAGRALSGLLAFKLSSRQLIFFGQALIALGLFLQFSIFPVSLAMPALFLMGLGCGPIFPSMLHETPRHFGAENSQALIGLQMAGAYCGILLVPPLFGLLASAIGYRILPFFLTLLLLLLLAMTKRLYKASKQIL